MTHQEKEAKLQELVGRMDPRDRKHFLRSRRKFKPNLEHDLFVASMFVKPRRDRA